MTTIATPVDDNTGCDPAHRAPLLTGHHSLDSVTETVSLIVETPRPPTGWYVAFAISLFWALVFFALIGHLILNGVGVWGNNSPVMWAWDIVNFVFWVGIGHAGTLISAILLIFRQRWRTSINRAAEAMTIFAVICAGIYPGVHVGRIWYAYWLAPYPNHMTLWPNFRGPLLWDVFAVGTYFTVSLLYWYLGMIPDLATLRDRARSRVRRVVYGLFSMGWRGTARQWHHLERASLILGALATGLVLSVHTVVSFDFAVSQVPGWHTTIFPPYFVAGAIFSGFAMVVTLLVPAQAYFGLKDLITMRHLENMNRIILATSCMVSYAYGIEFFMAWYSGVHWERFALLNRAFGPYAPYYWTMVVCNVIIPHLFWFKKWRTTPALMLIVAVLANIGMWMERFVIIAISLSRSYLPSSWREFVPTWVDIGMLLGSFGLFMTLFLLFCRFLPMVAMAEVKAIMAPSHAPGE